jgi:hypothetical protein
MLCHPKRCDPINTDLKSNDKLRGWCNGSTLQLRQHSHIFIPNPQTGSAVGQFENMWDYSSEPFAPSGIKDIGWYSLFTGILTPTRDLEVPQIYVKNALKHDGKAVLQVV